MNNTRFITKAELARRGKSSSQLIGKYCGEGKKFHHALTDSGKLDADDPVIIEWLKKREAVIHPNNLTAQQFGKLTINQVIDHYGNVDKLEGYIKVRKMIVETEHKQIQIEASREELVSREFVGKSCFGIVNASLGKLLDMPRGIVERIAAILETAIPGVKEEAEQVLTEEISKILETAKKEVAERLGVELAELDEKDEIVLDDELDLPLIDESELSENSE